MKPTLLWLYNDFRLLDNPALYHAAKLGAPILPVFIFSPEEEKPWAPGAATRWWLHQSLNEFAKSLENRGLKLILRKGQSQEALNQLISETGADKVYWNKRHEPWALERDEKILRWIVEDKQIEAKIFLNTTLFDPREIKNKSGGPFRVYTPFSKACLEREIEKPLPKPTKLIAPKVFPKSLDLETLDLLPQIGWDKEFYSLWTPGEAGAKKQLNKLLKISSSYQKQRDLPAVHGTSRLSPHLHFGEISPRQVWHSFDKPRSKNVLPFLRQILWREFSIYSLFYQQDMPTQPIAEKFRDFAWESSPQKFKKWARGQTGFPIVDAGMRELWKTGWMHNRVRMIVASFLTKDLFIPWQKGEEWFWDTLLDADLANNSFSWQWVAGCGLDAAPYFRIFNPSLQSKKFDPNGDYIRKWVPELSKLSKRHIHAPHEAPKEVLKEAGVELKKNYPQPIVNHRDAREAALSKFNALKLPSEAS